MKGAMTGAGKPVLLAFAVVAAALGAAPRAQAQNYPWCAFYGNADPPANCGFVSFDQCMADVSGIGGFCMPNNTYRPPATARPRRRLSKRQSHSQS